MAVLKSKKNIKSTHKRKTMKNSKKTYKSQKGGIGPATFVKNPNAAWWKLLTPKTVPIGEARETWRKNREQAQQLQKTKKFI